MKHFFCAFFVACAALCGQSATPSASGFVSGQAARALFGQATFTAQDYSSPVNDLGGMSGLAFGANMLFVADSNRFGSYPSNNRIIIFKNISANLPSPTAELNTDFYGEGPCPVCDNHQAQQIVLGQSNLLGVDANPGQSGLSQATAVATNGQILAVADTNNNRVLLWHTLPTTDGALPDTVLGQANFNALVSATSQSGMSGPQGVWIQGNRLFVADTVNGRVLVWNNIPAAGANNTPADYVLGEPNFTTTPPPTSNSNQPGTTASNMVAPVGVSSDGTHLFVTDLGQNRVMIWNSIPTTTYQPADVIVGQPDTVSSVGDNVTVMCPSDGTTTATEANGTTETVPAYPPMCESTLDFPRFALSDGTRLFVADGGNDRVLIFNKIPTTNGASADIVLGQPNFTVDNVQEGSDVTDTTEDASIDRSGADQVRTPSGLAWDGTNLYVSDPYDRRVLVFSEGNNAVSSSGTLNSASLEAFAVGSISFSGTVNTGNTITVTIDATNYTYTTVKNDTITTIIAALVKNISDSNSGKGDPNVWVFSEAADGGILLTSRVPGAAGDNITYSATDTDSTDLTVTALNANLQGGTESELGPGSLVTFKTSPALQTATYVSGGSFSGSVNQTCLVAFNGGSTAASGTLPLTGTNTVAAGTSIILDVTGGGFSGPATSATLSNGTATCSGTITLTSTLSGAFTDEPATTNSIVNGGYTHELSGIQVYFDGIRAPILYVSPTQINAQLPFETQNTTGSTAWIRTVWKDGTITATVPSPVGVVGGDPGIFAMPGNDPRPAMAMHYSNNAIGLIDMEGTTFPAGETVTATINSVAYTYTIQSTDTTLANVETGLINVINTTSGSPVTATASGEYNRVILTAKKAGSGGNGITIATTTSNSNGVTTTALNTTTCCASKAGTPITSSSPAVPGETIVVYATGLGTEGTPSAAQEGQVTGKVYTGPAPSTGTTLTNLVDDSEVGGLTANVLFAGLAPGTVGLYEVILQLDNSLPANGHTPIYIAQQGYVSNIVTIPVN